MTQSTDLPEGWIVHDGGECPVPEDSSPAVMFADGEIADCGDLADSWVWKHDVFAKEFFHLNIIAYKPEQPQ